MNRIEALVITGKLEIRFQKDEQILKELENLQKFITKRNLGKTAVSFGRICELVENSEIDVSEYMQYLYGFITDSEEKFQKKQEITMTEEERKLNMTLEELELCVRGYNCLKRVGINTVRDLVKMTEEDFRNVRNLGKSCTEEVISKLKELGFEIGSKI